MRTRLIHNSLLRPLPTMLGVCVAIMAATGAALAQQSAQTAAAIGAQGASQTGAVTDYQDQVLSRLLSQGAPGDAGFEFPTGRLRETRHDSYRSLLPNHGPTYQSDTVEESLIGSAFFKFPGSVHGGNIQTGAFVGENWIGTSYKSPGPSYPMLPGTRSLNSSYLAGAYVLYSSGSSYAMNTVTIFEGTTQQWGGGLVPGSSSYDTHGVVSSTVSGHVFDLDKSRTPLRLDVRGGILYSNVRGDWFSDPSGQLLHPSTQQWIASLSAMVFQEWALSRSETLRPYIKAGLREQLSYVNKEDENLLGALDTYRFSQSGTLGTAEIGFDYAFSNVTITGALYGEKAVDQATIGGRLGAKFALDSSRF
jgi:hypothetical protein